MKKLFKWIESKPITTLVLLFVFDSILLFIKLYPSYSEIAGGIVTVSIVACALGAFACMIQFFGYIAFKMIVGEWTN